MDGTDFNGPKTITLTDGPLNLPSNTTITGATSGSGATLTNLTTVSGGQHIYSLYCWQRLHRIGSFEPDRQPAATGTDGGGIANAGGLTVSDSMIAGNTAAFGGGIYNAPTGGGISNTGTLTSLNTTVSGNTASSGTGGGIHNTGTVTLANTIVSRNTQVSGTDVDSSYTDNGGNLVGGTAALAGLGGYGGPHADDASVAWQHFYLRWPHRESR